MLIWMLLSNTNVRDQTLFSDNFLDLPSFVGIICPDAAMMERQDVVEVMRQLGHFIRFGVRITAPLVRTAGFPTSRLVLSVHKLSSLIVATLVARSVGSVGKRKQVQRYGKNSAALGRTEALKQIR